MEILRYTQDDVAYKLRMTENIFIVILIEACGEKDLVNNQVFW
ncbi:hypothetical protein [Alkalibacter mobilis]|nr:hypothetical protein [Alkalibacter mobilis]